MGAFSWFKDKNSKKNKQETPTVESHYIKLARKASFLRYTVLLFIVLFGVYSFSFHSSEITVDNFDYMMKFLNVGEDEEALKGSTISFDGSTGNRGLIYKGDLAVLNENGLTVTGWDGEIILRDNFSFDHPKMLENGKNIFCYDVGGKELRIFNSYSRLARVNFDYAVHYVDASANGEYCVVSSAKGYRSAVYVYDGEFRIRYKRFFSDNYVNFAAMSPNGQEFIVAAQYSKNGNLATQISRFSLSSDSVLFEREFIGEIPLGIYFTENGYQLLTTDTLRSFDNDNEIVSEVSFDEHKLLSGRIFGARALINYGLEGLSGGTETVIYGNDGSIEYTATFDTALSDTMICGNTLYALSPGVLSVCDIESDGIKQYSIPTSFSALVRDENSIILVSDNRAEYFNENSFERIESK